MNKVKNVLIEVSSIRPGGGPFGYCYNLFQGYAKIKDKYPNINLYSHANSSILRTKSKIEIKKYSFLQSIILFIKNLTPTWAKHLRFNLSNRRREILKSDIVIFQGFQPSYKLKSIRKKVFTIYMPHSPTITADEILMNSRLYNTTLKTRDYLSYKRNESELIKNADLIVFASQGAADEYFKNFEIELINKRIEFINSGIDLPSNIDLKIDNKKISNGVFFIGRYVEHKGFKLFCEAAKIIKNEHDNINFFAIGGGPIDANEYVIDLGWQENPYPFINAASLIVVPNIYSYYDLLPLECAALGKPMVMTLVGGSVDQINKLTDTLGCKAEVYDLADTIKKAYKLKQEIPNWGEQNRIVYNEFYDSSVFAERWCELIKRI